MAYTPTAWVDNAAPYITAANLNKLEGAASAALGVAVNVTDQGGLSAAITAASADSRKPAILLSPGTYTLTSAITPFTGMRLIGLGRGSEFGNGVKIVNTTTNMFTPTADVSDIHIEGIQFEGNTSTKATDWWTVGTGFQILYSHIDKCGFTGFKRVYHGNWTGVTFENFYVNTSDTKVQQFKIGGADCQRIGPGFIGSSGFNRTTLTATTTSGAGPKVLTVADPTGAVIGNPIYVGNQSNGASGTRDVSIITNISGNDITVGTLANTHNSGEFVHLVMDHAAFETTVSHTLFERLYISPGPGMALHVKGGHSNTFFNCVLSGAPAISAGPGLYVIDSVGHQFINTDISQVGLKPWGQFNSALAVYDSTDLNFAGTIFDNISTASTNLIRLNRSGAGGAALTDRIKISGTTRYLVDATAVTLSENAAMAAATTTINFDEARPFTYDALDRGYRAETLPTQMVTGSTAPATAGRLEFAKIRLSLPQSITNIVMWAQAAGATLTAGQCFAALFNSSRTLIAQTADQSGAWVSTGLKTMALASGPFSLAAGDYFVGFWYNGTTSPTWGRGGGVGSVITNAGVSSPNLFFGSADTGLTTTAPGTMGAQTAQANAWWVALS